jgi:dephospho-CoA kinase
MSSTTLGPVAETTKLIPLPQLSAVFGFTAPMEGGKTTVSQAVSEQLNLPRVSFGDFPRRLAISPELPVTNETVQDLGERLVCENAVEFCRSVLTEQHIPSGVPLLIEGVRQQEVLDALALLLGTTPVYLIFMNIDPETQSARLREDDLPSEKRWRNFSDTPPRSRIAPCCSIAPR